MKKIILGLSLAGAVAFIGLLHADAGSTSDPNSKVLEIIAKRFEFSPAEITLKKGEAVTLRLKSEDVTHGFLVRPLKIDAEIPAGKSTDIAIVPQVVGKFISICNHFCGRNHGNMKMTINVVE
jgi:cytochrome c oxidase subunit II